MEKMKELIRSVLSALGWLLLGVLLMQLGIGPWWVSWLSIVASVCVIAAAMDKAFEPKRRWKL